MPPKKRAKPSKYASDDDDASEVNSEGEAERVEAAVAGTEFRDKDGTRGWELGNKRRITVSTFKGKQYVAIREYYEKDGKLLPGKKGINLTVEQFRLVVSLQEKIDKVLGEDK